MQNYWGDICHYFARHQFAFFSVWLYTTFCFAGVVQGSAYFTDKDWLCELVASCCLTACLCAFFSLTVVTINRFVYVCHQNIYTKIFSRTKNILMCVCIWLASFTLDMPNFFGWGDHYFDMKNHSCIWDRTASLSYTMLVSVVLIMGSLCLMGFCHFRIFLHIHKSRTKVSAHRTMGGTAPANRVWAGNMKRHAKSLLGVCGVRHLLATLRNRRGRWCRWHLPRGCPPLLNAAGAHALRRHLYYLLRN